MAHFAKIENGMVTQVIVAENLEWCENNLDGEWIQTSYNTYANKHPENRPLNKNFAGLGFYWDGVGFYAPQPYPSWTLNEESYIWEAPVMMPDDGHFYWDEEKLQWIKSIPLETDYQ